jgi:hypothetical protein
MVAAPVRMADDVTTGGDRVPGGKDGLPGHLPDFITFDQAPSPWRRAVLPPLYSDDQGLLINGGLLLKPVAPTRRFWWRAGRLVHCAGRGWQIHGGAVRYNHRPCDVDLPVQPCGSMQTGGERQPVAARRAHPPWVERHHRTRFAAGTAISPAAAVATKWRPGRMRTPLQPVAMLLNGAPATRRPAPCGSLLYDAARLPPGAQAV